MQKSADFGKNRRILTDFGVKRARLGGVFSGLRARECALFLGFWLLGCCLQGILLVGDWLAFIFACFELVLICGIWYSGEFMRAKMPLLRVWISWNLERQKLRQKSQRQGRNPLHPLFRRRTGETRTQAWLGGGGLKGGREEAHGLQSGGFFCC